MAEYEIDLITLAFGRWRRENSTMPTPADIRDILIGTHDPVRFVNPQFPQQPDVNDWKQMTADEKERLEQVLLEIRRTLSGGVVGE